MNGLAPGRFAPDDTVSRQQAMAITARYLAVATGQDPATSYSPAELAAVLGDLGDADLINDELLGEVALALELGIARGDESGNLVPQATLTRIEGAALLIRAQGETLPPSTRCLIPTLCRPPIPDMKKRTATTWPIRAPGVR